MREILFRGKRKAKQGVWLHGDLTRIDGKVYIWPDDGSINSPDWYEVREETVGQFTGLTDKNGVNIFSDDLRKDEQGRIFRIYSMPGGFAIKDSYWASNISDLILTDILIMHGLTDAQTQSWIRNSTEAAGNIHDNPELLN